MIVLHMKIPLLKIFDTTRVMLNIKLLGLQFQINHLNSLWSYSLKYTLFLLEYINGYLYNIYRLYPFKYSFVIPISFTK